MDDFAKMYTPDAECINKMAKYLYDASGIFFDDLKKYWFGKKTASQRDIAYKLYERAIDDFNERTSNFHEKESNIFTKYEELDMPVKHMKMYLYTKKYNNVYMMNTADDTTKKSFLLLNYLSGKLADKYLGTMGIKIN